MDKTETKKPTLAVLKSEIDKLKISFENEKKEKDTKLNQILTVVQDLGTSLNSYSTVDIGDIGDVEGGIVRTNVNIEEMEKYVQKYVEHQMNEMKNNLETHFKASFVSLRENFTAVKADLEEELKKKDAAWQQKYDIMFHNLTRNIEDMKLSRYTNVTPQPPNTPNTPNTPNAPNAPNAPSPPLSSSSKEHVIKFAPLSEFARKPMRGSEHSAGIDLRSAYEYTVPANGNKLIKTDWKNEYPKGYFGKICSRSGLSLNHNIEVGAGIVDADYSGPVNVVLNNHSGRDFHVAPGDKIAQLICTPYITPTIVFCNAKDISDSGRGENGFGSTGIN
jgi:dUTP diphosphatase